jgi:polar amino acid transport system substrate-binding protein
MAMHEPPRDLAPGGTLRVGLNFGNPVIVQPGPGGGDPRGVGPSLARALARRAGLAVRYVGHDTAGKLADAVRDDAWDVAFLAIDAARAVDIAFTGAYVHIEGTYMVRDDSPLRALADFDREGVHIAVGAKTAYDLHLTRALRHAKLVREATSAAAVERFLGGDIDAVAGVRQPLVAAARAQPGLRVLDASFMVIRQAAAVPRGRDGALAYVAAFIEDAKRTGFVAQALRDSGVADVAVAPASG